MMPDFARLPKLRTKAKNLVKKIKYHIFPPDLSFLFVFLYLFPILVGAIAQKIVGWGLYSSSQYAPV